MPQAHGCLQGFKVVNLIGERMRYNWRSPERIGFVDEEILTSERKNGYAIYYKDCILCGTKN